MLLNRIIFIALAMFAASAQALALATAHTASWEFSVEMPDGPGAGDKCELVAKNAKMQIGINVSGKDFHCEFLYPVKLTAGEAADGKSALVFLEGSRGGENSHTTRLVEVYALGAEGFSKLGREEFFPAAYVRRGGEIVSVVGRVMFAVDPLVDGLSGKEEGKEVFVPAVLTPGSSGVCVRPSITGYEKKALIEKFNAVKEGAVAFDKEYGPDLVLQESIKEEEERFHAFLDDRIDCGADNTYMAEKIAVQQAGVAAELVSSATLVSKRDRSRYSIGNLFDGNPATTWATKFIYDTNYTGDEGLFKIVFKEPVAVKSLTIWNGLQSSRQLFLANQRVRTLEVDLVGTSGAPVARVFELKDSMGKQEFSLAGGTGPASPEKVRELVFAVHGVYAGNAYRDLCISEMAIGF